MNNNGFEIERKFLIDYPERELLDRGESSVITQTYLAKDGSGMNSRVRKRVWGDKTEYTHTRKKHISDIRRVEEERLISENEYNELLKSADLRRKTIHKTRYCIESGAHTFEIDIFPFWDDRAIMEVELSHEDERFTVPQGIRIIREVTDDKRYTNSSLAREIPQDEIT